MPSVRLANWYCSRWCFPPPHPAAEARTATATAIRETTTFGGLKETSNLRMDHPGWGRTARARYASRMPQTISRYRIARQQLEGRLPCDHGHAVPAGKTP